jgi:hypothetical protein
MTNGRMPEYRSLAPCAKAINETPRRFHETGRGWEAVVNRPSSHVRIEEDAKRSSSVLPTGGFL